MLRALEKIAGIQKPWLRLAYLSTGIIGLAAVYLFQNHLDLYSILIEWQAPKEMAHTPDYQDVQTIPFVFNKVFRYILNDLFAIAILYALFYKRKYLRFSFYVMLFGLVVLVPLYLIIYLQQPPGLSSMLSHLHRLVMNPVLMMILIPAFFYQEQIEGS